MAFSSECDSISVLDFNCPQFVDFGETSENSGKEDDLFFDCKNAITPQEENNVPKSVPDFLAEENILTEEGENRLLNKMDSALMEITPNVKKPVKSRILSEKFPKDKDSQVSKVVKPFTQPSMHDRLLRSKSIAKLNKIVNQNKDLGLRKRSSSLGDLRTQRQKYPLTPMCLKRTIVKSKNKVIKTTEERELEEIARLQQKLARHLRLNEINLKKMNLNPRPCVVPKAPGKAENKGLNNLVKDLNIAENRETRPDLQRIRKATMKIDSIINRRTAFAVKNTNPVLSLQNPSVSSTSENKEENGHASAKEPVSNKKMVLHSESMFHASLKKSTVVDHVVIPKIKITKSESADDSRTMSHKKVVLHSGLKFLPSFKNSPAVNPFVVNPKIKVTKSESDVSGNISSLSFKMDDVKENIPHSTHLSNKKNGKMQNTKIENKDFTASSRKVIGKQPVNISRGLPLAENTMRH